MTNFLRSRFYFLAVLALAAALAPMPGSQAHAADKKTAEALKPEEEKAQKLLQQIDALKAKLNATVPNSIGIPLPALDSPGKVLDVVDELREILKKSASDKFLARPESARALTLNALKVLYRGRGNTSPKDGTGWNLANRGSSQGLSEIQTILSYGLLDDEGKKEFAGFLAKHDFNDAGVKKSAGFPPQFEIGNDGLKSQVSTALDSAKAGPAFQPVPKIGNAAQMKSIAKIVEETFEKTKDKNLLRSVNHLLGAVEQNHFDKSVAIENGDKQFPNYWGREKEQNEVLDIFTKGQKQHILVEGPAGVGKTTLFRALQDRFIQGAASIRDELPPIFLELPITAVTNPSDPSQIKSIVSDAAYVSEKTGRRIVLLVDEGHVATTMTQNALKGFLTEITNPAEGHPKVHIAFLTTSAESQTFMNDTAFSRRFSGLHVNAFSREDTIKLIKQTLLPRWRKDHKKNGWHLKDISDDALEYAYRYRKTEQQFAETGTQELLEAAIVNKMNRDTDPKRNGGAKPGEATLDISDVRNYIGEKFNIKLMPGDPNFNKKFEEMWADLEKTYVGNDALKSELRETLRNHFGQPYKKNVTALAVFGPPGGGKTFGAEEIGRVFFNGAILETNGADLKNGGLELNKLIGSPPGVKDSDSRGELTRMLREHPEGFVWKIEEGDYMHQDVVDLKTNIITSKKFKDGMGKEWDASKILIWENSNIGQDLMIPKGSENKMDWGQYETRRQTITQKAQINGKIVEKVRPDVLEGVFRNYIDKIVTKSNPDGDTSNVEQEAAKQIRRYTPLYVMPPTREELIAGANSAVDKFVKDMKLEHGVEFEISRDSILKLIDLDQYNFKMGHGYINKQLERKLIGPLLDYLPEKGKKVKVSAVDSHVLLDGHEVPSQNLVVEVAGNKPAIHPLGAIDMSEKNPWGTNPEMMKRLENFSAEMGKHVKGNTDIIEDMGMALKEKAVDWNANTTFTLLGTSGNGKTETAKSLAKAVYGSPDALFTITGVDHPWDLADYFRPPTGIQGGNKETQFERWFLSRKSAGGGVDSLRRTDVGNFRQWWCQRGRKKRR